MATDRGYGSVGLILTFEFPQAIVRSVVCWAPIIASRAYRTWATREIGRGACQRSRFDAWTSRLFGVPGQTPPQEGSECFKELARPALCTCRVEMGAVQGG
jgi:hypothetical protein